MIRRINYVATKLKLQKKGWKVEEPTQMIKRRWFFGKKVLVDEDDVIKISDEMKILRYF
jgi:hypothetical protein